MSEILTHYYPDFNELTQEQIREARATLENSYRTVFPDLDMRPNSVFGDMWLTPAALHIAALDVAISRYKSDLNLGNIAAGVIWDCDFVAAYLRNFSTLQDTSVLSYGAVRLVFADGQPRTLPRGLVLNSADGDLEYRLRLVLPGGLNIVAPGGSWVSGVNNAQLVPTAESGWWVDVQVKGEYADRDTPPDAGETLLLSEDIPGLVSATTVSAFSSGFPSLRLKTVAEMTQETFYSASSTTKAGLRSFILRQFPDIAGVSVVHTGDLEMQRPPVRAVDAYVRAANSLEDVIIVRLPFYPGEDLFAGELLLPGLPVRIDQVVLAAAPGTTFDYNIHVRSRDGVAAPLVACGNSLLQQLYLTAPQTYDTDLDPVIPTVVLGGVEYADFQVTYLRDPAFDSVSSVLTAPENVPVGVSVLPRQLMAVTVRSLVVQYRRKPGTTVNISQARQEIAEYVNGMTWPATLAVPRIVDSLFYAGAVDVVDVLIDAVGELSPANTVVPDGTPEPWDDLAAFMAAGVSVPEVTYTTFPALTIPVTHPSVNGAISPVNSRYLLEAGDITFEEVA